jgi:hypothetical protein
MPTIRNLSCVAFLFRQCPIISYIQQALCSLLIPPCTGIFPTRRLAISREPEDNKMRYSTAFIRLLWLSCLETSKVLLQHPSRYNFPMSELGEYAYFRITLPQPFPCKSHLSSISVYTVLVLFCPPSCSHTSVRFPWLSQAFQAASRVPRKGFQTV